MADNKYTKKAPTKVLSYKEAVKSLNDYKTVVTVGNEPFYREQIWKRVISANKDLDLVKVDCSEVDEFEVFNILSYRDLFSTRRIVILRNFTKIKKLEKFYENDFNDIVILDAPKEGRSKAFKELKKKCFFIECSRPKPWLEESDIVGKILGFIQGKGYTITQDTASYLYHQLGYDLQKLMGELSKIVMLKEGSSDKEVSVSDINRICVTGINYNVFDLIDKIIEGNKKEAIFLINKIFKYESSPAILLISLWYTHLENLLLIKTKGGNIKDIYSSIKMPPMVVDKKLVPQSKKITQEKIVASLKFLTDIDYNLRKGSFDLKYYLDKFILDF